jgi:hypothetical protein
MAVGVKMEDSGLTQEEARRVEFVQEAVCFGGTPTPCIRIARVCPFESGFVALLAK